MDEYTTDYLEAAAEEAERFREAAMILAERTGVSAEEAIYQQHQNTACRGDRNRGGVGCGNLRRTC